MSKAQEILKVGKFTVHGIEYDVDFAGTNNDPANNILTGDIQRIHGTCPGGYVNVPPFNAELIEVTPLQKEQPSDEPIVADDYIPGKYDDVTVDPPTEETPAPEPTDEAPVVEPEPEPAELTPAPRRVRKH